MKPEVFPEFFFPEYFPPKDSEHSNSKQGPIKILPKYNEISKHQLTHISILFKILKSYKDNY